MSARRPHASGSGQVLSETAVILAVIAIGCVAALLFLSHGIGGILGSKNPDGTSPFTPPASVPGPTSIDQCENGGWRNYPQFTDEADCKRFVEGLGP